MWISTLVPERLRTTDLLDLSGMTEVNCVLDGSAERPARLRYTTRHETQKRSTVPFPSGTRGFLYCHVPDPIHPVATEIRFRLASGAIDDPQLSFALGEDLLLSPEIPWRIHMMSLARRSAYTFLATLLLQDGLVSQEVMDHWTNVKMPVRLNQKTPVLCRLNQPFVCRLDSCDPFLYVADKLDVHPVRAKSLMRDNRPTSKGISQSRSPYSGTWRVHRRVHLLSLRPAGDMLCHLESGLTKGGKAVAYVRVLKALTPITLIEPSYDGYLPMPAVGDVLRRPGGEPAQIVLSSRRFGLAPLLRHAPDVGYISPLIDSPHHRQASSTTRKIHRVSNLVPSMLNPIDFLDLSGEVNPSIYVLDKKIRVSYYRRPPPDWFVSFPTGTHGFLYAAEDSSLRFRVTKDAHPSSFASGHDLFRPNGQLWTFYTKLLG
jgi:hypothetical protein